MSKRAGVVLAVLAAIGAPVAGSALFQATQMPAGYWDLEDAAPGPSVDAIAAQNGAWTGPPTRLTANLPTTTFSYGNTAALGFSTAGANQYVTLPTTAALNGLQVNSYTLSAWFRPASIPAAGTRYAIVMKPGDNEGISLRPGVNPGESVFEFTHWTSDFANFADPGTWSAGVAAANTWVHVVGVWDGTANEGRIYLDGTLRDTRAPYNAATGGAALAGAWYLGIADPANGTAANRWQADGMIDDVRVYNFALNANQVAVLWNGVPAPTAVSATAGSGAIDLSWTAPPQAVTYTYDIGRRVTGTTTYTIINGAPVSGTTYSDATGAVGTSYDYVITAISVARSGPSATPATAVAPAPAPPPGPKTQSSGGNDNLAHRCGCSTARGSGALGIAVALAGLALFLRRR